MTASADERHDDRRYRGESGPARRAERRERLLAAGTELFGTVGFGAASVERICATAGLTKRYFYESFSSREELLRAVYHDLIDALAHRMMQALEQERPDVEAMVTAALDSLFAQIQDDPRVARILLFEIIAIGRELDEVYRWGMDRFATMAGVLMATAGGTGGAVAVPGLPDPPPASARDVAIGLTGATLHIAVRWVAEGRVRPRAEVVDACRAVVLPVLRQLAAPAAPAV